MLDRATELADIRLIDQLRSRGYAIDQSADVVEYLDMRGANAATFLQNDLLLRPDARKIEVLEEYLHNVQRRLGLLERMTPWMLEMHVKDFLWRHRQLLGISQADVGWLRNWLDLTEAGPRN